MKETIYTIPINEVFGEQCGCPLCALERRTETKTLDYIMGAAMMEPDVRETTNARGFCADHYADMLAMKNRLSLALTIESRLKTVSELIESFAKSPDNRRAAVIAETGRSCFVCEKIRAEQERYYANLLDMWRTEESFRALFATQEHFCLPHFGALLEHAAKVYPRRVAAEFVRVICEIERRWLTKMQSEIAGFTKSFDYRYAGEPFEKEAVEHAAAFLSSLDV
ncbi:MAG: DUF6062 family protein [Clostridiaceae bacterium]|nr:DUF6062 family protein [Clostridiaceae bacterium]